MPKKYDSVVHPIPVASVQRPGWRVCRRALSAHQCDRIVKIAGDESAFYVDDQFDGKADVRPLGIGEAPWLYDELAGIFSANNVWGFALTGVLESFRVLWYRRGGYSGLHTDNEHGTDDYLAKITAIIPLVHSSAWRGGVLHVGGGRRRIALEKGDCVLFPSFTMHEVTRVTAGTRMVLAGWASGPPFV